MIQPRMLPSHRRTSIASTITLIVLIGLLSGTMSVIVAEGPYDIVRDRDTSLDQYREAAAKWNHDVELLVVNNATDGGPDKILCLGSSSFRLWDEIASDMAPYQVVRRAYGGAKYCDLAIHSDRLMADLEFKAAMIFIGNDITGKEDDKKPEEVARLASKVIESIRRERPSAPVFLIAVTPTPSRFDVWPKIREANAALETLASKDKNIYFVATEKDYLNSQGLPREELFKSDRLHQNHDGYMIWSSILKRNLDRVIR